MAVPSQDHSSGIKLSSLYPDIAICYADFCFKYCLLFCYYISLEQMFTITASDRS